MIGYVHHILPCKRAIHHGIWNFAEKLAAKLSEGFGIESGFSHWTRRNDSDTAHIRDSSAVRATRQELISRARGDKFVAILLHFDYGSYGWYDLPLWLYFDLLAVKRAILHLRLLVFCHETPPLAARRRRERVLLPLSRHVFGLILRLSDFAYCSNPLGMEQIKHATSKAAPVSWRPIFSNIGEPADDAFLRSKNPKEWVVFGSAGNLPRYLESLEAEFHGLPAAIAPDILNVIGGGDSQIVRKRVQALRREIAQVSHCAAASDAECSEIFNRSLFCYLKYFENEKPEFPEVLLKSGVFAAANAHGVIPVICHEGMERFTRATGHPGGIWKKNGLWLVPSSLDQMSQSLFRWYQTKSSSNGMVQMIVNDLCRNKNYAPLVRKVSLPSAGS